MMKKICVLIFLILGSVGVWGQTPVPMGSQPGLTYTENFADIANWVNDFTAGIGASRWKSYPLTAGGTANDGKRTTKSSETFTLTTSGGVQKGTGNLVFLSTGSTSTSEAVAVDFLMDFTGVDAGTLSFNWATIDNSSGTRPTSLRIFWSIDNVTFTEIVAAQIIDVQSPATGSITAVAMPAAFNNSATARLRFYNHAGAVTGSGSRDKISIDDFTVTATSAATPSIDISTPGIGASTESQGATNVILQRYDLAVTSAAATLNGLTVTTAGTYVAADITNLKVRYSADATLDVSDATLSTKSTGLGAGSQVFPSFTPQAILTGTTGYVFVTADISATATAGNTINIESTTFSNISFAGTVNKTGTDPVAAGGAKTFAVLLPDIAITSVSPVAGNINQNSNNNILYAIQLDVTTNNTTLNSATFTTGGTYQVADLKAGSFKLWINSVNSMTGATQLGTGQAIVASGNTISFSSLSTIISTGTTRYLLVTTDVAFNATAGNTVNITSTPFTSLVFASGNKTGTDPVSAGNDQTIAAVTPLVAITQTGPAASSVANGSANIILYQWNAAVTANNAVLTSVSFPTAGTYVVSDLVANSFKFWYNSTNSFGTATQISSAAIVTSGSTLSFSGLTQQINAGASGYFWVTVDIDAAAVAGNTINIGSTAFTNLNFGTATLSGIDPMAAGGVKTIVVVPAAGEIVINQFNPAYSGASDEYIELVNKTNKSFDLSALRIAYQSAGGTSGSAGGTLTGTLLPHSYWLLSPNATVTVGLTSALPRDGAITTGFAAANGQFALQVISTSAVIDALGYGTLTGGTFSEGTPVAAPTSNSGYKRNEGDDTNSNIADFTAVTTANIDLRNSSSRLALTGANIAGSTYSRIYVKGNSSLVGNTTLTERIEILSGIFSLGSNNLTTLNTVGGSLTAYIQTNGSGSLIVNNITTAKTLPIGNTKYNPLIIENGSGLNWTVSVADGVTAYQSFNTNKAVLVTWNILPSVNPPPAGADITFQFDEATTPTGQTGINFSTAENVQAWHAVNNSYWLPAGNPVPVTVIPGASTVKVLVLTAFSPYALANVSGPLPINVNYFTGAKQGSNHLLNWKVTCQSSARATMILERSADSRNFTPINTVTADAARCNQPFDYTDAQPLKGMNYYRLKMVDADGKITYSSIVAILNAVKGYDIISIAPNPVVNGNFKLNVASAQAGKMEISIFDMQGRLVIRQSMPLIAGFNSLPVNVANLSSGSYTIRGSIGDDKTKIIRFVKE